MSCWLLTYTHAHSDRRYTHLQNAKDSLDFKGIYCNLGHPVVFEFQKFNKLFKVAGNFKTSRFKRNWIFLSYFGFLRSVLVECLDVSEKGTVSIFRVTESGSGGCCSASKKECVCYMWRLNEIPASKLEERIRFLPNQWEVRIPGRSFYGSAITVVTLDIQQYGPSKRRNFQTAQKNDGRPRIEKQPPLRPENL